MYNVIIADTNAVPFTNYCGTSTGKLRVEGELIFIGAYYPENMVS